MARIARLSPTGLRHELSSLCALKIPLQYHFASTQYFLATSAAAQRNNRSQNISAEAHLNFGFPSASKKAKRELIVSRAGINAGARASYSFAVTQRPLNTTKKHALFAGKIRNRTPLSASETRLSRR